MRPLVPCLLFAAVTVVAAAPMAARADGTTPESFLDSSLRLYQEGRYQESIEAAREAIRLRPGSAAAHNNVCAANCALERWGEAIAACESAVALLPSDQLARNNLAWARNGRNRTGPTVSPTPAAGLLTPEILLDLSLKAYQEKRFEESILAAREALRRRPTFDSAWINICAAYNELGEWKKAAEACQRALELNPASQLARNNLAWTEKQRTEATARGAFWRVAPLQPHTVNFIDGPSIGRIPLAGALLCLVFLSTAVYGFAAGRRNRAALPRAFLVASAIAALIFAARMDYEWVAWLARDARELGPLDLQSRSARLDGWNLVGLARDVRGILPPGKSLSLLAGDDRAQRERRYQPRRGRSHSSVSFTRGKMLFYLLPVVLSEESEYVLVVGDRKLVFDQASRTLSEGAVPIAENVDLVKSYSPDVFLCRVGAARR